MRRISLVDRANPILVKEARQALRGRLFRWGLIGLMAAGCLVAVTAAAAAGPGGQGAPSGRTLFLWYFGFLCLLGMVVVPSAAASALANEIQDRTFELVAITALTPGAILRGKILSALVQSLLYASALVPFLAFTYFLRGIDMLTILFLLGMAFVAIALLTVFSLFFAVTSHGAGVRRTGPAVLIAILAGAAWGGVALARGLIDGDGVQTLLRSLWTLDAKAWIGTVLVLFLAASYAALFFAAAAAKLSFESANSSTPVRAVLAIQWTGWTAFMGIFFVWSVGTIGGHWASPYLWAYAFPVYLQMFLAGFFLCTEPDLLSRRVHALFERKRGARRWLANLFYPGGARGFRFTAAICTVTLVAVFAGAWYAWMSPNPPGFAHRTPWNAQMVERSRSFVAVAAAACCYAIFYLGLPLAVLKGTAGGGAPSPRLARIAIVGAIAGGCLAPLLVRLFLATEVRYWSLWALSNPFWTLYEWIDDWGRLNPAEVNAGLWVLCGAAVLAVVLNLWPTWQALRKAPRPDPRSARGPETAAAGS